jgi:molybdopterin converting factor small subunit
MKKTVRVTYFALLREERGVGEERVETSAATAADLYEELRKCHGFTLGPERLRVAINDGFEPWGTALHDADSLVFIPPVAGG